MESEELFIRKQMISKAKMCFCEFCNGYGFIVSNFVFYGKHKTSSCNTCIQCNGTGFYKNWKYLKRMDIRTLIDAKNRYLPIANDFTAEQIRGLSKKNLKHLHQKKKMSIMQIAKKLNMFPTLISKRFKLYNIKNLYEKVKK